MEANSKTSGLCKMKKLYCESVLEEGRAIISNLSYPSLVREGIYREGKGRSCLLGR
jgi:hypothetical protein